MYPSAVLAKVKGFDVFVSDMSLIKDAYYALLNKYEIEWEEQQQEDNKIKLKALEKSNDIKTGFEALINATLSGVIIPFLSLIY